MGPHGEQHLSLEADRYSAILPSYGPTRCYNEVTSSKHILEILETILPNGNIMSSENIWSLLNRDPNAGNGASGRMNGQSVGSFVRVSLRPFVRLSVRPSDRQQLIQAVSRH